MFSVLIENSYGNQLELLNDDFRCVDISGIGGATADINETENANLDGSIVNSERIKSRTIELTIRIFNNCGASREKIYNVAFVKQYIKLTLYNDIRSVYIEGKVKSIETPLFTQAQTMTLSILCPDSYFKEAQAIENEFSLYEKMFHFPFNLLEDGEPFTSEHEVVQAEIANTGDVATGAIFHFRANGNVSGIKLYNTDTNEYIKLNFTMQSGDDIYMNTNVREKEVYLIRENVKTNLIGSLDLTSSWLQIYTGTNKFSYTCDSGANKLEVYISYTNKYLGV